ncbi:MAG: protein phosphatase 2C domain-containing protein [Proteobacteria bacterium]|nr:protein phosphatase 2C domain-containing protein [Pseudomonadota bacterium]
MVRSVGQGLSDIGRRRKNNQDAFLVDDILGLYIVADGMGGHKAGEVASTQAITTIRNMIKSGWSDLAGLSQRPPAPGRIPDAVGRRGLRLMESAVQAATYMICAMADYDPSREGMGTTVSALLVRGPTAVVAQVGDSRVYRVRGTEVQQLTEDHTVVAYQIKNGHITPEQARFSPYKNMITRAVGSNDYVQVDTLLLQAEPGDRFLLCSDGLHGYLGLDEVLAVMQQEPGSAVQEFVQLANQRGGRDNITALIVDLD